MRNFFENGICKLFGVQQRPTEKSMHNGDIENNKPGGNPSKNAIDENELQISEPTAEEIIKAHGPRMSKETYDLIKDNNTTSCCGRGIGRDGLGQKSPGGNTLLHIAALYGNDNCVDKVIQSVSCLLVEQNINGDTPLHVAARAGPWHISILKKLLAALLNYSRLHSEEPILTLEKILVKNKEGNTFFHEALLFGHKDVMTILDLHIKAGLKKLLQLCVLFWTNEQEKSVFHIATEEGYHHMVEDALTTLLSGDRALDELIQNNKDLAKLIRPAFPTDSADMFVACPEPNKWFQRNGNHQDLRQDSMTENHREPTQFIPYGPLSIPPGESPLNLAIFKRDEDMLRILVKKKEWIHIKDNKGRIALHYAALIGYLQGVEVLLRNCVDCNMERDEDGLFPIHLASAGGHVDVVKKLLEQCPNPTEILDNYGRNIAHIAVEAGMLNVVEYILEDAKHGLVDMINDKDVDGNTPLNLATFHRHSKIEDALTRDKRVEPSSVNRKNQTVLNIKRFPQKILRTILQRRMESSPPEGNNVLHDAAWEPDEKFIDEAIQSGSKLLHVKNSNGDTPLHVAARAGHISTLKKLLAAVLNDLGSHPLEPVLALEQILVKNKKGNTFFHEALLNGHKDVMKILDCPELHIEHIKAGFKELVRRCALFWTNKEEKSVFHIAIEEGYKDMVEDALTTLINHNHYELGKLIENDQDLVKRTPPETFRHINKISQADMKMADRRRKWLERNGNHQDLRQDFTKSTEEEATQWIPYGRFYDPPGKLPLNLAIFKRDQDMLRIILTRKKEWIHKKDNKGRIALHYAASIGYLRGVEILLRSCNYCNMGRDDDGLFPIHLASAGGHVDVVKKLLEQCPDPTKILDNYDRNIVHIAAEVGMLNVVRYILQDANHELVDMINDKDVDGNTPLHLATLHYHPKVVHALIWDKRAELSSVNRENQTALDAYMKSMQENPPLRQRLTWIALESGGVKYAKIRESHSINAPIRPQCAESLDKHQAPNMDLYKDRINTLTLVSTLITTVAFAAGFTLPGGTNSSSPGQGMALMLHHLWFKLFIFCIILSMYGAISVTIILIWAQLGDISLAVLALKMAKPLLGVALATLSVAFMAGIHLVISDLTWLATAFLVLCVISILMLLLLYTILWLPSSSSNPVMRYISYYPFQFLTWLAEDKTEAAATQAVESITCIRQQTAAKKVAATTAATSNSRPQTLDGSEDTEEEICKSNESEDELEDRRNMMMMNKRRKRSTGVVKAKMKH